MEKRNIKNMTLYLLILGLLLLAIYGAGSLSLHDFQVKNVCPKILSIPACYIVLGGFTIAMIGHLFPFSQNNNVFFAGVGMVTLIATVGSIAQITGLGECPKTSSGIPMCFLSLGICVSLLLSKVFQI